MPDSTMLLVGFLCENEIDYKKIINRAAQTESDSNTQQTAG